MSELFTKNTQAIVYGLQMQAVQRMLDFDYVCKRDKSSVACMVSPVREGFEKVFFGVKEILIPVYRSLEEACKNHPNADVLINFASFRSVYDVTLEAMDQKSLKTIVIIAEGVPERRMRELGAVAKQRDVMIIGPATVGGLVAGAFKIGNSGGDISNIISCKLYRPGSVGMVSKSGGMSNELYNIISQNTDGLYEGIAIGGDRFAGTNYLDHILRFEANPKIKMIVALGEIGGEDEYEIIEAIKNKKITKPVVMWVTGTCSSFFPGDVQFGHAAAKADSKKETAEAKNQALKEVGVAVPESFNDFGKKISEVFQKLNLPKIEEPEVPEIPMDYKDAVRQGKIRKPTTFISTTTDERGEELEYSGIPISQIVKDDYNIGDLLGIMWFKMKLPKYASEFLELLLKLTADHGPAVSGAHNSIVAARAGKNLVSSLCSGLLTIGPRYGGAVDDAASYFKDAKDSKQTPEEFVNDMKIRGRYIPGIGHRVKSVQNPDKRVEILVDFAKKNFKKTEYLDYALEVEKITTKKRNNLILNVDGCIAVCFLDIMLDCGFSEKEVNTILETGGLNGLFVLGRTIGLIGHIIDQKRMKQPLYRHPWDDILYIKDEVEEK
ncbi:MAG: citrate/2-methylcitrate synthase [Candidatus Aenigmatarchaeota archaeon]